MFYVYLSHSENSPTLKPFSINLHLYKLLNFVYFYFMKEWQIQAYVSTELKRLGVLHHSDQNAGRRSPQAQAVMKATGACAGWPDMCVIPDYGKVIYLEFKLIGGKLSKAQKQLQEKFTLLGVPYYVVQTNDPIEAWDIVKRLVNV